MRRYPWVWMFVGCCATTLSLSACRAWKRLGHGEIATRGVEIRAEDGSFHLRSGEVFMPPFYCECQVSATTGNFMTGERMGARRVRVLVPERTEPLYGLLSLCKIHPDVTGPVSRSYQLLVPKKYVDATDGDAVSVVVEQTNVVEDGAPLEAWQLWLSQRPFPRSSP